MIPYKWPLETAVPDNPEVRREIAKAMQTLAEDRDGRLRQRRAEIASIRRDLQEIAQDFRKLCRERLPAVGAESRKYGYNPDEPRVPKHSPGGGEWTRVAGNDDPNDASDAFVVPRQPYAQGHHWVPRVIFENKERNFSTETRVVLEKSTSGPLADRTVNYNNAEHRAYNYAVDELVETYLKKSKITSEQMTPTQAGEFVQEVIGSSDPRIRGFVLKIRQERWKYIRRYGAWRRGGGDED